MAKELNLELEGLKADAEKIKGYKEWYSFEYVDAFQELFKEFIDKNGMQSKRDYEKAMTHHFDKGEKALLKEIGLDEETFTHAAYLSYCNMSVSSTVLDLQCAERPSESDIVRAVSICYNRYCNDLLLKPGKDKERAVLTEEGARTFMSVPIMQDFVMKMTNNPQEFQKFMQTGNEKIQKQFIYLVVDQWQPSNEKSPKLKQVEKSVLNSKEQMRKEYAPILNKLYNRHPELANSINMNDEVKPHQEEKSNQKENAKKHVASKSRH